MATRRANSSTSILVFVHGDQSDVFTSNAGNQSGTLESTVTPSAHIHGGTFRMASRFSRSDHRFDADRRPAARQQAAGVLRVTNSTAHPIHANQFQLARSTSD